MRLKCKGFISTHPCLKAINTNTVYTSGVSVISLALLSSYTNAHSSLFLSFSFFLCRSLSASVSFLTIPFSTFSAAPFGECAGEEDKTWKRWRAVSLPWLELHWLHSYLLFISLYVVHLCMCVNINMCMYVYMYACVYRHVQAPYTYILYMYEGVVCVAWFVTCLNIWMKCEKDKDMRLQFISLLISVTSVLQWLSEFKNLINDIACSGTYRIGIDLVLQFFWM